MEFTHLKRPEKRKKADALVIPFWKDKIASSLAEEFLPLLGDVLETNDFKGKEGEILYVYLKGQQEKRVILMGLGAKEVASVESLRKSYGPLTKSCLSKQIKSLNLLIPENEKLNADHIVRGVAEGLLLPNYIFNGLKHKEIDEPGESLLEKINWIGSHQNVLNDVEKFSIICQGVDYTRDLVNGNADDVTPQYLEQCAYKLAGRNVGIKTTVFNKKRIETEKLGLLLAVNRGSASDPVFIIMEYQGNPESKDHTILVGKGITYDTGGLNLKPTGSMETMKCDMGGAAACFGTILVASLLKLKVNLTVVIPSTENSIDAKSFKPGDVYSSYSGKSVEVTNTDAEGRLILADGIAYAAKNLKPTRMIDIATLTGAIEIALGPEASGLMSNGDDLADQLSKAGDITFERLWRMPLYPEYKERLKSDIADLKSWNGRAAGANVAATFLRHFVDDSIPWAHIDIAATAYGSENKKYLTKYASGVGVRLLIEFLERLNVCDEL